MIWDFIEPDPTDPKSTDQKEPRQEKPGPEPPVEYRQALEDYYYGKDDSPERLRRTLWLAPQFVTGSPPAEAIKEELYGDAAQTGDHNRLRRIARQMAKPDELSPGAPEHKPDPIRIDLHYVFCAFEYLRKHPKFRDRLTRKAVKELAIEFWAAHNLWPDEGVRHWHYASDEEFLEIKRFRDSHWKGRNWSRDVWKATGLRSLK